MDIEAALEQGEPKQTANSLPFPISWWGRFLYGLFVTVSPILSFSSVEFLKPQWQTGRLADYIILFLFPEASLVFIILLAYSVISYLFLLISPTRDANLSLVRFGIYTGVLLSLQYTILVMISAGAAILGIVIIWIFPLVYSPIYRWAVAKWTAHKVDRFLLVTIPGSLLLAAVITRGSAAFLVVIALILAAPFWSLLLSLRAANWLIKNYETRFNLSRGLGLAAWIAAYAAAWRFDILKMYELYAALPPAPPPDCYIATAAARGHPRFVQARTVRRVDGTTMQVNAQLQRLKCAELALLAIHPHLHKTLRGIYDRVGQALARRIQHPHLADLAYLVLKPCEWLARIVLGILIPEIDSISQNMYVSR